jgi:hypothetical protein
MRATQTIGAAHLGPNFQHVFERHTRVRKLILQQHDHIIVVLLDLLLLSRFGPALGFTLLDICLKRCNLPVDTCNVLFDDESELLYNIFQVLDEQQRGTRTLISTGRSSNSVFRFATVSHG